MTHPHELTLKPEAVHFSLVQCCIPRRVILIFRKDNHNCSVWLLLKSVEALILDTPHVSLPSSWCPSSAGFHAEPRGKCPFNLPEPPSASCHWSICFCVQSIIKSLFSGTISFNLRCPFLHKCSSQIYGTRWRTGTCPLSCTHPPPLLPPCPQISPVFLSHCPTSNHSSSPLQALSGPI